jgi:hypothetical protein
LDQVENIASMVTLLLQAYSLLQKYIYHTTTEQQLPPSVPLFWLSAAISQNITNVLQVTRQ